MKTTVQNFLFAMLLFSINLHAQNIFEEPVRVFAGLSSPTANVSPYFVDFNGDGLTDLGVTPFFAQSTHGLFKIYLNDGQSNFATSDQDITENFGIGYDCSCFADVNGDGRVNILLTGSYLSNNAIGEDYIFNSYSSEHSLRYISHGYMNNDEYIDLIVHDSGAEIVYVAYNNGSGEFNETVELGSSFYLGLADPKLVIRDFNNDGLMDVVLYPTSYNQSPFFYFQQADGSFSPISLPIIKNDMNYHMDAADLDGDGDLEFIYNDGENHMAIMNNDGVFSAIDTLNSIGGNFYDFNLDGVPELLHIDYDNDVFLISHYNAETESYSAEVDIEELSDGGVSRAIIVDFDNDGDLDILMSEIDNNFRYPIYFLENNTIVTSQENIWTEEEYAVFPNPSSGYFNFQIKSEDNQFVNLQLFDPIGNKIMEQKLSFGNNQIKLNQHIASGLYFYQIEDENHELLATGKIIKTD